jgi:hypothetical protein
MALPQPVPSTLNAGEAELPAKSQSNFPQKNVDKKVLNC